MEAGTNGVMSISGLINTTILSKYFLGIPISFILSVCLPLYVFQTVHQFLFVSASCFSVAVSVCLCPSVYQCLCACVFVLVCFSLGLSIFLIPLTINYFPLLSFTLMPVHCVAVGGRRRRGFQLFLNWPAGREAEKSHPFDRSLLLGPALASTC